jgi:hypothetical protein
LVFVSASTAIDLVGLPIPDIDNGIAAIPTVEDVRAIASINMVIAASHVDDIIASALIAIIAAHYDVIARPSVDDVVARSSEDSVHTAKAAYLVVAVLTVQPVILVGA